MAAVVAEAASRDRFRLAIDGTSGRVKAVRPPDPALRLLPPPEPGMTSMEAFHLEKVTRERLLTIGGNPLTMMTAEAGEALREKGGGTDPVGGISPETAVAIRRLFADSAIVNSLTARP